jgi:N-acetylglucosamine-6-phosphate deacetylase
MAASFDIERPFLAAPDGLEAVPAVVLRNGRVASRNIGAGDGPRFDAEGLIAAPGYIDLQINGGFGIDLSTEPEQVWELGRRLPETGATAFYPTLISPDQSQIEAMQKALAHRPDDYVGAEPLGIHLEGPILAPTRAGIHDRTRLQPADPSVIAGWASEAGIALVTLAPELPGALGIIATLTDAGVVVSGGHSEASEDETAEAEQAGMSMVTHLFNAMTPLHHRQPGMAGRVLTGRSLTAGIIADGHHVAPSMISLAWRLLGPDRLLLVSDAVAALGQDPGPSTVAGIPVEADDETVRHDDGTLAGTRRCLAYGVRQLIRFADVELVEALAAASTVPANAMGLSERGNLSPGSVADVVVLNPDLTVAATVCGGQLAYVDPSAEDRLTH